MRVSNLDELKASGLLVEDVKKGDLEARFVRIRALNPGFYKAVSAGVDGDGRQFWGWDGTTVVPIKSTHGSSLVPVWWVYVENLERIEDPAVVRVLVEEYLNETCEV